MTADDLFAIVVAYEAFSALSKRCPPVTDLCRRWPLLAVPVLAVTLGHLRRPAIR